MPSELTLDPELTIVGILSRRTNSLSGTLSGDNNLSCVINKNASIHYYDGPYEFTPGDEEQQIDTENKMLSHIITINRVPSTYGRIDWNGSFLTVS